MTDEKFTTYLTRVNDLKELQSKNSKYNDVSVEILSFVWPLQPETKIAEKWHNGGPDKEFHKVEFPYSDIDNINRKLYDKIRYRQSKDDISFTNPPRGDNA